MPELGRITHGVLSSNTGSSERPKTDLFGKTSTTIDRFPYDASPCTYCWSYTIEDDTIWGPGGTIKVTVHLTAASSGDYVPSFFTSNGVTAEKEFTV